MQFNNWNVYNFDGAFRGMRLPMNSGDKSDSGYKIIDEGDGAFRHLKLREFIVGDNDMNLAQRLIRAGSPHDKFMRQIFVSVDVTAPLYLWKELDQHKVGTVTDSESTMHRLASNPITRECFEMDDYQNVKVFDNEPFSINDYTDDVWDTMVDACETLRKRYIETKDMKYWKELIRILPESWLQTRTWTANYAVLRNIVRTRKGHKLTEWKSFIDWIHKLPYSSELIFIDEEN